jgi:predicted outer membrane repeat protein
MTILAVTVTCSAVQAGTTIYVDATACPGPGAGTELDPYCSIQFAIDNSVDTDEIILAEGTYVESIDLDGRAITLRSTDPLDPAVVGATVIDGNGAFHVVLCNSGEGPDTMLDGLTITGGVADGAPPDDHRGGGMYCLNTSPTISRCVFTRNIAVGEGGGLMSGGGNVVITDCTFTLNTAFGHGGGIAKLGGDFTVTGCTFSDNTASANTIASGGQDNQGGAIYSIGTGNIATITDCTFMSNFAGDFGGGIAISTGTRNITNCTFTLNGARIGGGLSMSGIGTATVSGCSFSMNDATGGGGGMRNSIGLVGPVTISDCTFDMNTAGSSGAGLNNSQGGFTTNTTVTRCTFTGNVSPNGGGMDNDASSPIVTHCTFIDNMAILGGAMNNNVTSSPTVTNCLFVGNTTGFLSTELGDVGHGGAMTNAPGSFTTVTNCTFKDNSSLFDGGAIYNYDTGPTVTNCVLWGNLPDQVIQRAGVSDVTYSDIEGGFAGTGNIDVDPLFADADGRLSAGSPAIDAGNNAAPGLVGVMTDLDENPRFVDDPATPDCQQAPGTCGDPPVVDMGAYELQPPSACPCDCADPSDGTVNVVDFLALIGAWGGTGSCDCADPSDGVVNVVDFLAMIGAWGPCP